MIAIEKNNVSIGNSDKLEEWGEIALNKIRVLLKNYLELDNVSFLFGAGSSVHLGSISIANIPTDFEIDIKKIEKIPGVEDDAYNEFLSIIKQLQQSEEIIRTDGEDKQIIYPIEGLLNYLIALQYVCEPNPSISPFKYLNAIISSIKRTLFDLCDLDNLDPKQIYTKEENQQLKLNRYFYHEKLVKKILQRPLNLKRANIFTTNYDLAFENAFDNQGVYYIDGFTGFQNRCFRPETFDYDIFYPGSTTQGKVHRTEKVIRYYKIHGSLSWVRTPASAANIYGIKEVPIDLLRKVKDQSGESLIGEILIYPSATKRSYTLDFPYSELFRQFGSSITQPQSVLFTYGYSFSDDHINDIIFQALSIPSFTLIIIDYLGTKNPAIKRLKELNDPRIIILEGEQLGDFLFFTQYVIPDLVELNTEELVAGTLNKIYGKQNSSSEEPSVNQIPSPEITEPLDAETATISPDEPTLSAQMPLPPPAQLNKDDDDLPF